MASKARGRKRSLPATEAVVPDTPPEAEPDGTPDAGYSIGYGRPPKHARFKPGQSGNPKGRPKGARSTHVILHDELHQKITVIENGRRTSMTKLEYLIRKLVNGAMQKGTKEFEVLLKLMQRFEMPVDADAAAGDLEAEDAAMLQHFLKSWTRTPDKGEGGL